MKRQSRAGIAIPTRGKTGVFDSLTGAVDVDLISTETWSGDVRRLAPGWRSRHPSWPGGGPRRPRHVDDWRTALGREHRGQRGPALQDCTSMAR